MSIKERRQTTRCEEQRIQLCVFSSSKDAEEEGNKTNGEENGRKVMHT